VTVRRASWLALLSCGALAGQPAVRVDHHQHLVSPAMAAPAQPPIDAAALVGMLDEAGIGRAVVLSNAFMFGNPRANPLPDEYERVKAENDWTAAEAATYPQRLVAFCGFNPLKDYALTELERCARDARFGRGIKLQFGASDVDLDDPADVAKIRGVFAAANARHLAIVVHLRTRRARHYGAPQARLFIDELLAATPDVPVQIAHFTGGGAPQDAPADEALREFIAAIQRRDPRVKKLYFDVALVASGASPERREWIAARIREIGLKRVLYGSDGGDPTDPPPGVQLQAFHQLPLAPAEFRAIERNVAPWLAR
jgi:predicted TIM-barrel fold metal-dependent hydrolase